MLVTADNPIPRTTFDTELYDPATNTWSALDDLNVSRYGQGAALLPDGDVLVTGGDTGGASLSSAELYEFCDLAPAITSAECGLPGGSGGQFHGHGRRRTGTDDPRDGGDAARGGGIPSAGLLSGTPAAGTEGTFSFTITASNTDGTAKQSFTLTVDETPAITGADQTTFMAGQAGQLHGGRHRLPRPHPQRELHRLAARRGHVRCRHGVLGAPPPVVAASTPCTSPPTTAPAPSDADVHPHRECPATVSSVSVRWGTRETSGLATAADGLRLLPQGRKDDLPWWASTGSSSP